MNADIERYWKEFEKASGEKVEARALGQWFPGSSGREVWGLLILTDKSFHFRGQESENWLLNLVFSAKGRKGPEAVEFSVPRESLVSLAEHTGKGLGGMFGPAFLSFTVAWKPRAPSDSGNARFSIDSKDRFLEAFRGAFPPPGSGKSVDG